MPRYPLGYNDDLADVEADAYMEGLAEHLGANDLLSAADKEFLEKHRLCVEDCFERLTQALDEYRTLLHRVTMARK